MIYRQMTGEEMPDMEVDNNTTTSSILLHHSSSNGTQPMDQKSLKAVRRRRLEMRRMLKSSLPHTHESKHMILSPSHSPSPSPSSSSSSSSAISPPKRIKKEDNRGTNSNSSANSGSFSSASSPPSTAESNLTAVITQTTRTAPTIKCSSYGSVCLIGKRREMEDTVTVAPGISPEYDFFGVYDGHGGKQVAETCRDRMHLVLKGEVERRGSEPLDLRWREVMEDCFRKMDAEVLEIADEGSTAEKTIGSTAVVAVVAADSIVVANCGDSRAVLCRDGVTVPLSSDHKPNRADEMERVEAAGGRVVDWDGFRVLGVLATSRSIGDQYLKPFVTSEPEVTVTERMEKDEFLILASDGLWDVVTSEVACGLTRMCLKDRAGGGGSMAATALTELALSRGSRDNVSVVVVVL